MIGCVAVVLLTALLVAASASAQPAGRIRVTRATAVLEQPRGDSFVLGSVAPGTVLRLLDQNGQWYLVTPTDDTPGVPWRKGWILRTAIEFIDPRPLAETRAPRRGELMVRGFGQFGGALFTARDSFEAILDSPFGLTYGGGGQVVFRNGVFVQGDIDRFSKSGFQVIVSDDQLFRAAISDTVTMTALLATVGFRQQASNRIIGYIGGGIGWHVFEERSSFPADPDARDGHFGFQIGGGAEYPVAPFAWLAGEVQWTTVPDGLGTSGVGPVFGEKDLGATRFRLKIIIGR